MNLSEVHQEEPCVHSSNSSCLGVSPTPSDVLMYMSVAAVVLLTVCGNQLVIISICHFKRLHTPTNFLLLSLAVADFLVGAIVMPLYYIMLIDPYRCFGAVYCTIFDVSAFLLTCVSIYNVALIAVDRYLALCNPFQYSTKITVKVTLRTIFMLWLFSLIYNVMLLYFNGNFSEMKENVTCGECIVAIHEIWAIADFLIVFIVPCTVMIILYLNIFFIAIKHANEIRCAKKGIKTSNCPKASERKAAKTLGILVSVFLLCLVPYYISAFLLAFIRNRAMHLVVTNTLPLIYLNSSINPIIYALFYPWFQRSVKLILTLKVCGADSSLLNVLVKVTKTIPRTLEQRNTSLQ